MANWPHPEATPSVGHVLGGARAGLTVAWLSAVTWSMYEVVLTRLSRSANEWAWPDGLIVGLVTLALFLLLAATAGRAPEGHRRLRAAIVWGAICVIPLGALALVGVAWAVRAPLPELRAVALPAPTASPETVVRTLVAAWDFHDEATAAALCGAKDSLCQGLDDYYVRARITEMGPPTFDDTDGMLPSGATGVDIEVSLAGETRDGGQVDVGGLVLAPVGPKGAWRVIDSGWA